MSLRLPLSKLGQAVGRPLFFDANVLIYLFAPAHTQSNKATIQAYNQFYADCFKDWILHVDVLVISEFVNTFLRIEYKNHLYNVNLTEQALPFKQFRNSPAGQGISSDIELIVKGKILSKFQLVGKPFSNADMAQISLAKTDFNDALIAQTCQLYGCVLVTHDADFVAAQVDILTANRKIA